MPFLVPLALILHLHCMFIRVFRITTIKYLVCSLYNIPSGLCSNFLYY